MVIPYSPGGGYDTYARLVAKHVPRYLPQDVNVNPQNIEGAGGRVALEEVAVADPDGYTLMIMHVQRFSQQHVIYDPDYDIREWTWFPQIAQNVRVISVGTHTDIQTFEDYVAAVRNEELSFASTGQTSGDMVIQGVLGQVSGLFDPNIVFDNQVVYDGTGEQIQGVIAEDVDVMAGSYSSHLPFYENGDLQPVLVLDDEPPDATPDVETYETAEPEIENGAAIADTVNVRRAFAGPPDIPDERAEILDAAIEDAIKDDDLQAEAEEADRPISFMSSDEVQEAVVNSVNTWESDEVEPIVELLEDE